MSSIEVAILISYVEKLERKWVRKYHSIECFKDNGTIVQKVLLPKIMDGVFPKSNGKN